MRTRRALGVSDDVVPYVGTWIEIHTIFEWQKLNASRSLRRNVDRNIPYASRRWCPLLVVPYVGTWIEISAAYSFAVGLDASFPTWERG